VSQISPPIRVVLIAAVAFLAAYMLFLRPKPVEAPPASQPQAPQTAEGKAVSAAHDAVNATNAQMEAEAVNAGETPAGTAAGTATGTQTTKPEATPAVTDERLQGLPKPVAKAVGDQKVLVLLFWNGKSADDLAVRKAMRKVDHWNGRVHTDVARISQISRYNRITRGADVEQSPTVVVVDRELHARKLVGYVDTASIDQAVVDAMRNTDGLIKSPYLRDVNQLCGRFNVASLSVSRPSDAGEVTTYVSTQKRHFGNFATKFKALPAPKKFRSFKKATVADNAALVAALGTWSSSLGSKPAAGRIVSSTSAFVRSAKPVVNRFNDRMDEQHVLACGTDA
jgi:hypothetical protein